VLTATGYHKQSIAYVSNGVRRHNQPFTGTAYGPEYVQGDVIGIGYRPRTGTIFFTRNGKKLDDVAHGLKTQNFFPTIGANGPCQVHVNFGQLGFVFIEANVKKWGLAPASGSLAPPPPYGSEQGSILLEGGREGVREGAGYMAPAFHHYGGHGHGRSNSQQIRLSRQQHPTSPGPQRSPTDISLAAFSVVDEDEDIGEGTSGTGAVLPPTSSTFPAQDFTGEAPPDYESPTEDERRPLLGRQGDDIPPIPSYEAAVGEERRGRANTRESQR
jgi:hypothetical protein